MSDPIFIGPAIPVHQPIGDFWVASIPASVLLKVTHPDPLRLLVDPSAAPSLEEWDKTGRLIGNQRPIEQKRLTEIADYIDTVESTFPNSIILAVNSELPAQADDLSKRWRIEGDTTSPRLVIPDSPYKASIVDGQHRLYAFLKSKASREQFMVICSMFFEMPYSLQAMVFATININQKPVRRGLALNLYGYNVEDEGRSEWSPEKLAVFFARRLNFDPASPVFNRIKIEADNAPTPQKLPNATRAIPMAAIVDGILCLVSKKPKEDRSLLRSERFLARKRRRDVPDDITPLRQWYRLEADQAIYRLCIVFLRCVLQHVWVNAPEGSMLTRAVGIRALFAICAAVLNEQWQHSEPPADETALERSLEDLRAIFDAHLVRVSRVDFSDPFFEASGRGQRRISNMIALRNQMITLANVPDEERGDFERLLCDA